MKPLVKCFISIGMGSPGKKAFQDSVFKFISEAVVLIATETEITERFGFFFKGQISIKQYLANGLGVVTAKDHFALLQRKGFLEISLCRHLETLVWLWANSSLFEFRATSM